MPESRGNKVAVCRHTVSPPISSRYTNRRTTQKDQTDKTIYEDVDVCTSSFCDSVKMVDGEI